MDILELIAVTVEEFHLAKLKFYHSESAEHANINQSFFFAQPISRYQYQVSSGLQWSLHDLPKPMRLFAHLLHLLLFRASVFSEFMEAAQIFV